MGDVDEERRGKEAFRVAQHGRPLAEQLLPEACHLIAEAAAVEPDMDRVVLHFDVVRKLTWLPFGGIWGGVAGEETFSN